MWWCLILGLRQIDKRSNCCTEQGHSYPEHGPKKHDSSLRIDYNYYLTSILMNQSRFAVKTLWDDSCPPNWHMKSHRTLYWNRIRFSERRSHDHHKSWQWRWVYISFLTKWSGWIFLSMRLLDDCRPPITSSTIRPTQPRVPTVLTPFATLLLFHEWPSLRSGHQFSLSEEGRRFTFELDRISPFYLRSRF
jgi:hypothetical protein